jgi:hypothetical protein
MVAWLSLPSPPPASPQAAASPSPLPAPPANELLQVAVPAGGITAGQDLTVVLNLTSDGAPVANKTVDISVALPNGTVVQQLVAATSNDGTAVVAVPTEQLPVGVNVTITATAPSPSGASNVTGMSNICCRASSCGV